MASATIAATFPGMRLLEQTPGTLRALLANATAEDFDWQPAPERWSISMVLAHLADVEVKGFVSRFRIIAGEADPLLPAYDQLALFRSGTKFDGMTSLTGSSVSAAKRWPGSDRYRPRSARVPDGMKSSARSPSINCSTNSRFTIWATSARSSSCIARTYFSRRWVCSRATTKSIRERER